MRRGRTPLVWPGTLSDVAWITRGAPELSILHVRNSWDLNHETLKCPGIIQLHSARAQSAYLLVEPGLLDLTHAGVDYLCGYTCHSTPVESLVTVPRTGAGLLSHGGRSLACRVIGGTCALTYSHRCKPVAYRDA